MGAIDEWVTHPKKASKQADVVVLSVPSSDSHTYFEVLGEDFKPGTLLLDAGLLKSPNITWATELLQVAYHYIGITPVVGPPDQFADPASQTTPRADLFQDGIVAMVIPPKTDEQAVNLALHLVNTMGATTFFLDATEHDAVMATVETLPQLVSAALMRMAAQAHNWREIQRIAQHSFAQATKQREAHVAKAQAAQWLLNRENLLHKVDAMMLELQELKELIRAQDEEKLAEHLAEASLARETWLAAREHGDWGGQEVAPAKPLETPSFISSFLGLRPRRSKGDEQDS
jgi:prephenate dehydrogenase